MNAASEKELFAFLRDIDDKLGGENLKTKVDLFVLGGAAAVIAYGSPRGTMDIDAFLESKGIAAKLEQWAGRGQELSAKHNGIYFQPANLSLMLIEDPDWRERSAILRRESADARSDLQHHPRGELRAQAVEVRAIDP